jgi:flagellar FliL protein
MQQHPFDMQPRPSLRPRPQRDMAGARMEGRFGASPSLRLLPVLIVAAVAMLGFKLQVIVKDVAGETRFVAFVMEQSAALAQAANPAAGAAKPAAPAPPPAAAPGAAPAAPGAAPADAAGGPGGVGTVFYEMPEMLVNINTAGRTRNFLKIKVSLELASEQDIARIDNVLPRIVDNFQVYLRELRLEDLQGAAGMYRLREELLNRVNAAVRPSQVKDVLFKDMIVQ